MRVDCRVILAEVQEIVKGLTGESQFPSHSTLLKSAPLHVDRGSNVPHRDTRPPQYVLALGCCPASTTSPTTCMRRSLGVNLRQLWSCSPLKTDLRSGIRLGLPQKWPYTREDVFGLFIQPKEAFASENGLRM
jgi:hypothetical protein